MIENPVRGLAKALVNLLPEDKIIIKVRHPNNAARVLGHTQVEIPIDQIKDKAVVENAIESLDTPSVLS